MRASRNDRSEAAARVRVRVWVARPILVSVPVLGQCTVHFSRWASTLIPEADWFGSVRNGLLAYGVVNVQAVGVGAEAVRRLLGSVSGGGSDRRNLLGGDIPKASLGGAKDQTVFRLCGV